MKFRKLILASAISSALLLTGCGGEDATDTSSDSTSNSTQPTTSSDSANNSTQPVTPSQPEYIANLPAEPDETAAASTITGIDTNQNNVRDEVEVTLANIADNQENFNNSMLLAKSMQSILTSPPATQGDAQKKLLEMYCIEQSSSGIDTDIITALTFDTAERNTIYKNFEASMAGTITYEDELTCAQ
ncbi:hypothetical protein [uncultured Tolumonas sp.]|uniref:hypothetical protein n=1 Tax=uncultured Tolumonas sp. TaxID=263765 RepID=UPI002A0A3870|nr:hypothetical protein [uncultured Tolumonas sp.]